MAHDTSAQIATASELDLDQESGPAIDLTRLYRLWEANNWSAYAIDFSQDVRDWREQLTPFQRRAASWNYALFLHGEEAVARTLAPFIAAMPTQEQRVFLTTQIVDEARHHVFFTRYFQEVIGTGHDLESTLEAVRPELTWGFRQLFGELDRVTDRLRRFPRDRALLAQSIALYHLVIEGTLAHPGQHFIRGYTARLGILPGLAVGLEHVARDESRHMAFGIQVLGELCAKSPAARAAVIRQLNRALQWTLPLFISTELGEDAVRVFGSTMEEIYTFSIRSFDAKLKRIGIQPTEVSALVRIGGAAGPAERAARALRLLRAGVFGYSYPLRLDDEVIALMFDGLELVVNMPNAARVPGPIQWEFANADPWYLDPTSAHVYARHGRATAPLVTLRCRIEDWSAIAGRKLDPRWALLTRRLKVSGPPAVVLRLPAILGK
jgi:ribonucleotide reductase beta subunit family protein with ferritin-like domain